MPKAKVYFTKIITPKKVVELYDKLGVNLNPKTAIKVHSGEPGNQNFLHPEFWQLMVEKIDGTIVECNTAYNGKRDHTKSHQKVMAKHEWNKYFEIDILDAEGPDFVREIPNGKVLQQNYLGKDIQKYQSILVLSHFKGHPMGGFGGALKQLSIGCASRAGKCWIHSGGRTDKVEEVWKLVHSGDAEQNQRLFLDAMADAASSVVNLFPGQLAYINAAVNLSVDCDCVAKAEDPCMADIGIFASTDPIAIDQACLDAVKQSDDAGKEHLLERIKSCQGERILDAAATLGIGTKEYELIEI